MFTEVLSTLQQEFKYWHENLSHLYPKSMLRLATIGFLPPIYTELKYDVHIYTS